MLVRSFKLSAPRAPVCLKGAFLAHEASYRDALLVSATHPWFAMYRSQMLSLGKCQAVQDTVRYPLGVGACVCGGVSFFNPDP